MDRESFNIERPFYLFGAQPATPGSFFGLPFSLPWLRKAILSPFFGPKRLPIAAFGRGDFARQGWARRRLVVILRVAC